MSLIIKDLKKNFGNQTAINKISFSINKGEIVGFLGPNGAGKSTTMKIACGYLSPTSGHVEICGDKVYKNNTNIKYKTGYLQEHNPLYSDMYVKEYLEFIGHVYDLRGTVLKKRIDEIIDMVGLVEEQNKKIGFLSKGYRQRVGLAQALIHDPPVFILDEPTTGLDPNQIVDIRKLIKRVSLNKTVIFSTHIMQEVQAICDRVIIINKGKIIVDERADYLQNHYGTSKIWLELADTVDSKIFRDIKNIIDIKALSEREFVLTTADQKDIRDKIFHFAVKKDLTLLGLNKIRNNLETIFKKLTKE